MKPRKRNPPADPRVAALAWHVIRQSDGRIMSGATNEATASRTAEVLGEGFKARRKGARP